MVPLAAIMRAEFRQGAARVGTRRTGSTSTGTPPWRSGPNVRRIAIAPAIRLAQPVSRVAIRTTRPSPSGEPRDAWIPPVLGAIKLLGNQPAIPQDGVGLATQATSPDGLWPSRTHLWFLSPPLIVHLAMPRSSVLTTRKVPPAIVGRSELTPLL